ncbi:TPA: helix-turn-helix domain-containing protein [Acinetobacter baumannii]|uniref:plasmid replication DNA-binding protein n=1 Tax=Acinetobacter radioresistens TaxID=40216 RepID=UPI000CC80BB6|nr:plasmid replication DNA-binding protein [Acinetobacter radioresistens]PKH31647.1 hypothetical protein BJF94_06735 [Acinetobacter radioresistens]HBI1384575.1 helix-turn-helix domain-containing protein [Acinetobacter baumannii]HBI9064033.1 helix-turn-helix domain-containing protein [Acinetobacter baumannii]
MTTQLSVIEVAELYGFNRQTVYKRINKGELSKNSDGKIDLAEAIRVFGEPASRNKSVTLETPENTAPSKEVDMLREQIDMLKEQLRLSMERERMAKEREDIAQDREAFYQNQIETMQRLLMAPKPPEEAPASAVQKDEPEGDYHTKSVAQDDESTVPVDKGIHEGTSAETPESKPSAEEKPKKGFWSSIFS